MISNVHIFHILPLKLTKTVSILQNVMRHAWLSRLICSLWSGTEGETQVNKPWHQAGEVKMSWEHVTCPTEWSKSSTRKRADSHHYSRQHPCFPPDPVYISIFSSAVTKYSSKNKGERAHFVSLSHREESILVTKP